jgi:Ca2+-binding EF-hand superfamily protein
VDPPARIRRLYERLDTAQTGAIDSQALGAFLRSIQPGLDESAYARQVPVLMEQMDTNHDGVISLAEFAAAVQGASLSPTVHHKKMSATDHVLCACAC